LKPEIPRPAKRLRKWHSFAGTKREAQIECARLISEINGGTYLEPSKTTLAQFLEQWLANIKGNVSPRTHERYEEIAKKNLIPLLGGITLTKLQPMQISAAYTKALADGRRDGKGGLSPRTVRHMHRVLKQALTQAVGWQLLIRNPVEAVDPPKVERHQMTIRHGPDRCADRCREGNPYFHSDSAGRPLRHAPRRDRGTPVAKCRSHYGANFGSRQCRANEWQRQA
jgi:hypothetical protein